MNKFWPQDLNELMRGACVILSGIAMIIGLLESSIVFMLIAIYIKMK